MRQLLTFALILVFAGTALAVEPGSVEKTAFKTNSHVLQNQSFDGREGGETIETAVPITGIPFTDTGATCDNIHDYDEVCDYTGSLSPDVVYSYIPSAAGLIDIDLLESAYDTKVYVYAGSYTPGNPYACNDDWPGATAWQSRIEAMPVDAGVVYYIVVDGYGSDCGDYVLHVAEFAIPEPCIVECSGFDEGEPENGPTIVDTFNGGCNTDDTHPLLYIQELVGDDAGNLTVCGVGGWNSTGKDTDWYLVTYGASGSITWSVESEIPGWFFEIEGQVCDGELINVMIVEDCEPASVTLTGTPGSQAWIWAGAQAYSPPVGFEGYNFNYIMTFSGLQEGPIATESTTWDSIKSMYR